MGRLLGGCKNWDSGLDGGKEALGGSMPLRAYLAQTPSYHPVVKSLCLRLPPP